MGCVKGGDIRPNHHQSIAFAYVVRRGSFSAAAARMGVTQSTITQHIGNLEKTVGTLLLRRGRDGVELAPTGQEFYDLADRMVSLGAEVSERLEGFNAMKNRRLNVIGNAPQPALRIIATFRQRFPNLQVNFGLFDWSTATNMLRNRLADVGLTTNAPVSDAWERIHVKSAEYVLYCPNEHRLSAQASVSLKDLQEETVIIPERGSLTRKLLENACRTHAIALERTVTMATFPLMYEAVLQGTRALHGGHFGMPMGGQDCLLIDNGMHRRTFHRLCDEHERFDVVLWTGFLELLGEH